MSGLRPQTPKLTSSRPRSTQPATGSKLNPSAHLSQTPKSPPLTTSHNANINSQSTSYPFLNHSPGHYLAPKETPGTGVKIKIKASTTPEAKTRLMKTPLGPRPRLGMGMGQDQMRGMTNSDSMDSMGSGWIAGSTHGGGDLYGDEVDDGEIGPTETVMVSVRVRPLNQAELQRDGESIWTTSPYEPQLLKLEKGLQSSRDDREWTYDRILPIESDNAKCYATSAKSHVRSAMEGYNAVIFAYGQTASGKTFTLTGSPTNPGIIPLAVSDLFAQIRSTPDREFLLRASYIELYNENIIDLLSPQVGKELSLSEGKKKGEVVINGLTEMAVRTEDEVRRLLKTGEDRRKVGGTDWNHRSSRSHCVFRMVIESRAYSDVVSEIRTPAGKVKGEKMTRISTLSIIDLAGSEKHTTSKERNAEGKHINQSLLTLKIVISKLADLAMKKNNVTHVPYRDSKLTRLLQPSLSGDALISVICTVSPSFLNQAESLSTLSFASGLKKVMLRAQRKELVDPQALIAQYQNEIADLRALLREKGLDGAMPSGSGSGGVKGKESNQAMEKRLEELKSLILTSNNVPSSSDIEARPLSPMKLRYPKLNYDRSTAELQEEVHAASLRLSEQELEIKRLKKELAMRPKDPNARVVELQDELDQYKLIADDYERHLAEPTRKVREDVEKEYAPKIAKLESMLESKRIWANRLDENIRAVTVENKDLQQRCQEAEAKIEMIAEWINAATNSSSHPSSTEYDPSSNGNGHGNGQGHSVPQVVVDDFSPSMTNTSRFQNSTLTLSGGIPHSELASLNERVGTLTMRGKGLGLGLGGMGMGKMLREESRFDLAGVSGGDDLF